MTVPDLNLIPGPNLDPALFVRNHPGIGAVPKTTVPGFFLGVLAPA